ncbi:hypothetical protein LZ518_03855 [Sphingomonas sp. RB56-2]|uniref:Uncharacterized protein n=1 Tax=Sphingomonas brevis TaxID=2908206 RepID=A0ABT0S795_9SPHN|nr:hypothetical protein [Sphingomonas brevis]MCL6740268.1 hypothetical protein [Sphingomonas brevis]
MLSRIFWIGIAGVALIAGMILQDGNGILSWGDDSDHARSVAERIEARVDRTIDHSFDKMTVVSSDGEEVDVPAETKRALADAVGRLVKAETDLALLRVRDGTDEEVAAADVRRDQARADLERLKDQINRQKQLTADGRDELRDQIREDIHETVRAAVKN